MLRCVATGIRTAERVLPRIQNYAPAAASANCNSKKYLHSHPVAVVGSLFKKALKEQTLVPKMLVHDTKTGDEELVSFLSEEIATEQKASSSAPLPTKLDGFDVQLDRSEVTLSRKVGSEQITIMFNVNHTVDAEFNDSEEKGGKDGEMRSKPNFEIDIKKGNKVLSFSCSYLQDTVEAEQNPDDYQDAFSIDEVTIFEGEWSDETYVVAGDILDGYLYDLFMNMLEDRGITNEFADKLSDFATDYEHKLYIGMLTQLQNFLKSN